jgi:hypothetical protein
MKYPRGVYLAAAGVFLVSMVAASLIPAGDVLRGIVASPGLTALFAALYQILRDAAAFEKERFLQKEHQAFTLASASHMAQVAFDKHVQYCESYMEELYETMTTLFREGPTKQAMEHAARLFTLNRKFAAWIDQTTALRLKPFEDAVWKIGTLAQVESALRGGDHKARSKAIDEMYGIFSEVLHTDKNKTNVKSEIAVEHVKQQIRSILGIDQLIGLRSKVLNDAIDHA